MFLRASIVSLLRWSACSLVPAVATVVAVAVVGTHGTHRGLGFALLIISWVATLSALGTTLLAGGYYLAWKVHSRDTAKDRRRAGVSR